MQDWKEIVDDRKLLREEIENLQRRVALLALKVVEEAADGAGDPIEKEEIKTLTSQLAILLIAEGDYEKASCALKVLDAIRIFPRW
jgi:hypothetical protein